MPPATDTPLHLAMDGIEKALRGVPVLQGATLHVARGTTAVVLGPSGAGKSVLLRHAVGLLRPDGGTIRVAGERIDCMAERELNVVRRKIGVVFQGAALFDSMTVAANVAFPLEAVGIGHGSERDDRVQRALRTVGLADRGGAMPAELSGGQRKRVAIARAIVLEPELVFYDEPTTGLDPPRADLVNRLIVRLRDELGVTGIVVTHDLASAFAVADRMTMLLDGRTIFAGTPDALRHAADPRVQAFLRAQATPDELAAIHGGHAT